MLLIAERALRDRMPGAERFDFYDAGLLEGFWPEVRRRLYEGEDLLFIGLSGLTCLRELWLGAEPAEPVPAARLLGRGLDGIELLGGRAAQLSVRPESHYALHGVAEEPRMRIEPLLRTLDRFGRDKGTCGIRCRHYAPSLSGGHFAGACWQIVAVDHQMLADEALNALAEAAFSAARGAFIAEVRPEFAWYRPGECVSVTVEVSNRTCRLLAAELKLTLLDGSGAACAQARLPLMLNLRDSQRVRYDFYPELQGVYAVEAALFVKDRAKYGFSREAEGKCADIAREAFRVSGGSIPGPAVSLDGDMLLLDGEAGFFLGTHYYPSTTFFEASYRPVRLQRATEEIAVMRKTGMRLCRLWCDPLLDETSIRGMRALIEAMGENGMAVIVTAFSSWTREMRVNTRARQARFDTADMVDDGLIGLALKGIDGQCLYVCELAERLSDLSNIIWDFSNEFSVVDPQPWQLGGWESDAGGMSPRRNISLFSQWAKRLLYAARSCGAKQPVIFGVSCWDTGSDNLRCGASADIVANHLYCDVRDIRFLAAYSNPRSLRKPYLLEEFGGRWEQDAQRAHEYEQRYFEFLASGFTAALNYEWGVSWLIDALPGTPPYMKYNSHTPDDALEGFHFEGRRAYAKTWVDGSTGICPWIASTEYGVIWPCCAGETNTMRVMKQVARLGRVLKPGVPEAEIYVVPPFETHAFRQGIGYARKREKIDALLESLWAQGARFLIWQEDDLGSLPSSVRTVLYPNADAIRDEVCASFAALSVRGVTVLTGDEAVHFTASDAQRARVIPMEGVRVTLREGGGTRLLQLFCEGHACVEAHGRYCVEFLEHALLYEEHGTLRAAVVDGLLTDRGRPLIKTTMRAALLLTDEIELLPFSGGDIELDGRFVRVRVMDDDGVVAELDVKDGAFHVDEDMAGYRLILSTGEVRA